MTLKDLDALVRCWRSSSECLLETGATRRRLEEAERALGRRLPAELTSLYERCNGADLFGGNLCLYPLDGDENSLVHASDALRRHGWSIPPELVVFAGNGQGDAFGMWLSEREDAAALIVEVGAIFEAGSFSITGTSLSGFLRGRSAFYALLLEAPESALETIDVPSGLRNWSAELGDEHYEVLMRWANPDLPQHSVSSYDARLTAEDLEHYARSLRRERT